jgi:hypothetical protein
MAEQAIIEASMILHRDSLNQLRALANARALENIVVSDAFVRMADDVDMLIRILGKHLEIPAPLIDPDGIRDFLPILRDSVPRYRRRESHEHIVYQGLIERTGNEWITQIFFEEWEFLTSQSWLFAKIRKALDDMVEAGQGAVQMSQRKFEEMTRRLLNKPATEPLTPNDKVKAAAKWIAVGGAPIWAAG